jgi:cell division protein FtsW (lipid II flippase)
MPAPMTQSDRWKYLIGGVIGIVIVRLLFELINPLQRPIVAALLLAFLCLVVLLHNGGSLKMAHRWLLGGYFSLLAYWRSSFTCGYLSPSIILPLLS